MRLRGARSRRPSLVQVLRQVEDLLADVEARIEPQDPLSVPVEDVDPSRAVPGQPDRVHDYPPKTDRYRRPSRQVEPPETVLITLVDDQNRLVAQCLHRDRPTVGVSAKCGVHLVDESAVKGEPLHHTVESVRDKNSFGTSADAPRRAELPLGVSKRMQRRKRLALARELLDASTKVMVTTGDANHTIEGRHRVRSIQEAWTVSQGRSWGPQVRQTKARQLLAERSEASESRVVGVRHVEDEAAVDSDASRIGMSAVLTPEFPEVHRPLFLQVDQEYPATTCRVGQAE